MALDRESKELLWRTLEDLGHDDLKAFIFHMHLPPKRLDGNAKVVDVVNQLEKKHGEKAMKESVEILEKIQNHNLAQKLRRGMEELQAARRRRSTELRRNGSFFSVDDIRRYQRALQENLRGSYVNAPEGSAELCEQRPMEDAYAELNIVYGADATPDKRHEVLQMETCGEAAESIAPRHIFRSAGGRPRPVRTLLTVGFAGIGKTFLVRKFVLDWASGKGDGDVHLLFPFTFREMNLEKGKRFSLARLVRHFVWESKPMSVETLDLIFKQLQASGKRDFESSGIKVLFVLDGLDESRLKLDLGGSAAPDLDVTEAYPLEVLLAHLIKRNLLPCARVWITTRPVGVHDIPADLVDSKTEVKGFSESQRLDYFRKKFPGGEEVIGHIQKCRSIFIMCHVPIFCWITGVVLQGHLDAGKREELPGSLTQMYAEFLLYHLDKSEERRCQKSARDVKALAELAFGQLMKKQQIFYESDLRGGGGLDYLRAAKHSGVFTEIRPLKRNRADKMFQFIHLSVQEFLAALHVMIRLFRDKKNILAHAEPSLGGLLSLCKRKTMTEVHEAALCKACDSEGHLDLFLRFLLGLSLPRNQRLLDRLLKAPGEPRDQGRSQTLLLVKRRIERGSPERNINLFYCLKELEDDSLLEHMQAYLALARVSSDALLPDMRAALLFFLLTSDEALRRFDLKSYSPSHGGLLMLLPVVKASRESALDHCRLGEASCGALASVLGSPSNLRELDLSDNDLYDRGAELLSAGLAKSHCVLRVLRLSGCLVATAGCAALAEALVLNGGHLRELDLSYNDPGEQGKRLLTRVQRHPGSSLKTLNLEHGGQERLIPGLRKYLCRPALDPDTAHDCLRLSDGCSVATVMLEAQPYPPSASRFTCWRQVLCRNGLSGRCYWEVEVEGKVSVGVTYDSVQRIGEGENVRLGANEASWVLCYDDGAYSVCHRDRTLELPGAAGSGNLGKLAVFLDHPRGTLSFYRLAPLGPELLHTFRAAFTEPLYPAFGFGYDNGFDGFGDFVSLAGAGASVSTRF
ncbi:NLR family CARD domain-containing protein 3-like [Hippocampus zosterae]|uniref:NLR family CARD domain-containing protein 3-like n=1 Tax=Hippocampus zosterae TaxID=109293 RepID=UPI00223E6877|nr:NLR family CARD domain-containing protein 3-like [Hippocampus zosterae]